MNYLTHLFLADDDVHSIVGNIGADFMQGCDRSTLPQPVLAGMKRHYAVDEFTDTHNIVKRSISRIRPVHGRYSGIIIDVFYDHFLSIHWADYSPIPLNDFIDHALSVLESNLRICPPVLREAFPRMKEQRWLQSYQTIEGIGLALHRISQRLTRKEDLASATRLLNEHFSDFDRDFCEFFPELRAHIRKL